LHDVQIVPDIDNQEEKTTSSTNHVKSSSRKSSADSVDSVVLVQTPRHLKHPRHPRYSHHRHQQELLRRIQSMSSPPPTIRRVSRSTPSLTESDLEAYARGIRSIVPI